MSRMEKIMKNTRTILSLPAKVCRRVPASMISVILKSGEMKETAAMRWSLPAGQRMDMARSFFTGAGMDFIGII